MQNQLYEQAWIENGIYDTQWRPVLQSVFLAPEAQPPLHVPDPVFQPGFRFSVVQQGLWFFDRPFFEQLQRVWQQLDERRFAIVGVVQDTRYAFPTDIAWADLAGSDDGYPVAFEENLPGVFYVVGQRTDWGLFVDPVSFQIAVAGHRGEATDLFHRLVPDETERMRDYYDDEHWRQVAPTLLERFDRNYFSKTRPAG